MVKTLCFCENREVSVYSEMLKPMTGRSLKLGQCVLVSWGVTQCTVKVYGVRSHSWLPRCYGAPYRRASPGAPGGHHAFALWIYFWSLGLQKPSSVGIFFFITSTFSHVTFGTVTHSLTSWGLDYNLVWVALCHCYSLPLPVLKRVRAPGYL